MANNLCLDTSISEEGLVESTGSPLEPYSNAELAVSAMSFN